MEADSKLVPQTEPKPPSFGFGKVIFALILFLLVLLLAQSMVEHRFFQGGRVHENGSIGQ